MHGKYYDNWNIGETFTTPERTITEADVINFASMTGDYNELHTNKEYMANNKQFGERIAHGLLGLSVSHGLFSRTGYLDRTVVAFLGLEWKFMAPIFFGDTIHVKISVVDKKTSRSRPDCGFVKFRLQILNQGHTVVQEGLKTIMFQKDPKESK